MSDVRDPLLILNAKTYAIARIKGVRQLTIGRESSTPQDMAPFRELVPLMTDGMGASFLRAPTLGDYSLDVELEQWNQLGPGPLQSKLGLAMDYPCTAMAVMRDTSQPTQLAAAFPVSGSFLAGAGVDWTNASNITASDNNRATATINNTNTDVLQARDFSAFDTSVTSDMTVAGLFVRVEGGRDTTPNPTLLVQLVKAGTAVGSVKSTAFNAAADTNFDFGNSADMWGTTWTVADVQDANFGVNVQITAGGAGAVALSIDSVQVVVYVNTRGKYLYAGFGDTLKKIRLSSLAGAAALGTVETKQFTHGTNGQTALITAIQPTKDGGGPVTNDRRVTQPSDCQAIILFGQTAYIQQINAVVFNAADTYQAPTGTAYGGVATLALGTSNTVTQVWKSHGISGQATGPFSRVQPASLSTAALDLTSSANWGTSYNLGDFGSSVNSLADWQRQITGGKAEGVYGFTDLYAGAPFFVTRSYRADDNAVGMLTWGHRLVIPSVYDVQALPLTGRDPVIGISKLQSNLSPIQAGSGYSQALTTYTGRYLFVGYYDGTDTYLLKFKEKGGEPTPYDFLYLPMTKVTGHRTQAMMVTDDGVSPPKIYLFYGCASDTANKYDVGYCILDPQSSRLYATGGPAYLSRMGFPDRKSIIERLTGYGVSCDASNYWQADLAWDEGSFGAITGTATTSRVNANGRNAITLTPGTGDSGYRYQLRLSCTRAASSNRPRVQGAVVEGQAGILVEGQRQVESVDVFRFVLLLANNQETGFGGTIPETPVEAFNNLTALLTAGPVDMTLPDLSGSDNSFKVVVTKVSERHHTQDSPNKSERMCEVVARKLLGTVVT